MSKYVYIGHDATKKYFKIGITSDIRRREKEIRNMNPTYKMMYVWEPNQVKASEAESYFHSLFQEKRVVGEWFDLSIDDILIMTAGKWKYKIMSILGRKA